LDICSVVVVVVVVVLGKKRDCDGEPSWGVCVVLSSRLGGEELGIFIEKFGCVCLSLSLRVLSRPRSSLLDAEGPVLFFSFLEIWHDDAARPPP
jgi:hypothetical protein